MQLHQTSLVRFRQDLRVHDNTALIQACAHSESIIPIFVFESVILDQGPAQDPRIGFIIDAITQLDQQLRARGSQLYVLYGDSTELIPQIIQQHNIDAVYANRSYGRGSITRDKQISDSCHDLGVTMELCDDYLLVEPGAIEQRKVFSPYYRLRQQQPKRTVQSAPSHITTPDLALTHLEDIVDTLDAGPNQYREMDHTHKILAEFDLSRYVAKRNRVDIDGTSRLSPYTRFGIVSIRQVYEVMLTHSGGLTNKYIAELARREFWQHIMHYFPETVDVEFQERKRNIAWINDESQFEARCEGRTGYPMIDAAMIQLHTNNRMHGRTRMLVASFLTKHLLIDRRRGEQHFARYLIDYDRNVNIGNRQRSASVGADPKPLRIFSPIIQAQKFDPKAIYIKHYLPQLADVPAKILHDPITHQIPDYPAPIVDHLSAYRRAREVYRQSYDLLDN